MKFSDYTTMKFERRGRVLNVTFNQPEKLNSFAGPSHTELSWLFYDLVEDKESDIIVLTGAGRAFSAGGDIEYMQWLHDNPAEFYRCVREAKRIVNGMLECDKPIICKVNGDAIGLGSTVAVFSDIIFAADTARFGDPHNNVALISGDGGQIMWPYLMGYARAKHYLFTGEKLSAAEAERFGLINKAMPAAELNDYVDAYADKLAAMPVQSLRWSKTTINVPLRQMAASMMDVGMAYENISSQHPDHVEAIAAFREKRKPVFNKQ
ncbi:enoyl-CoA hydratase/isomerase family protein [Stutzerimonas kunmingensis]|jgi:enoyl-CoA hydratase|uniref:enoyl-CoA hydratase/isomerase family protein n=1 Tax=Stutzerimonas kunmingensis TaxID=1211807 RepID=UPI0026597A75|nr:enoyl-CoA hydratase-related protein [Stutzerimonas kunmingensis]MCW8158369.1 enoyl-CoA hydratase/isomerase family protein [Stutzerimonas stutzeri]